MKKESETVRVGESQHRLGRNEKSRKELEKRFKEDGERRYHY